MFSHISSQHPHSEALSPWGAERILHVNLSPLECPFRETLTLPGSKSFTNRALIIAAVAHGESILRAPLFSDDSFWCLDALRKLGIDAEADREVGLIKIQGCGAQGHLQVIDMDQLPYLGSAGTIARFLPGIIAARGRGEITLTSSSQLAQRPILPLIEALRQLGAEIEMPDEGAFPMRIRGGSLRGGDVIISGATSSQFISGLLIAAPLAENPVRIQVPDLIVQSAYVKMTLEMMESFGVKVDANEGLNEFIVHPQKYVAQDLTIEADVSTATYFFALAAANQSTITITNINTQTLQPDLLFLDHLKELGCEISINEAQISLSGPKRLRGDLTFDLNPCADSAPALAGIAPFAQGPITLTHIEHIRHHECDRIAVMAQTLKKAGVKVREARDGLLITPTERAPSFVEIDPHDDHRMAMAFAVMAISGRGGRLLDPACVSKTCPQFLELIAHLGARVEEG